MNDGFVDPMHFKVGDYYIHSEHGLIRITGGPYHWNHAGSNFFRWTVVDTNEKKSGYSDAMFKPDVVMQQTFLRMLDGSIKMVIV